jgi:hypothetical protein
VYKLNIRQKQIKHSSFLWLVLTSDLDGRVILKFHQMMMVPKSIGEGPLVTAASVFAEDFLIRVLMKNTDAAWRLQVEKNVPSEQQLQQLRAAAPSCCSQQLKQLKNKQY